MEVSGGSEPPAGRPPVTVYRVTTTTGDTYAGTTLVAYEAGVEVTFGVEPTGTTTGTRRLAGTFQVFVPTELVNFVEVLG
jgi:hypothetical protein